VINGPKKLVKRAQFVAKLLDIDPEITMEWSDEKDNSYCQEYDDGTFTVGIQKWMEGSMLVESIGHELVHVWQHIRGDLYGFDDEKRWIWKGQMYTDSGTMDEYFLRPWEMEARAYEQWIEWRWRHR
jgi:hypothetical protein